MPVTPSEYESSSDDDNKPSKYLDRVNFVTKEDPLDALLIRFQRQISKEETPSRAQQKEAVFALRRGDLDKADDIVTMNKGMIAALAYPYRAVSFDNFDQLMSVGESVLLEAAMTYNLRSTTTIFTEYAALLIDQAFQKEFPWTNGDAFIGDRKKPTAALYQFMSTLERVDSLEERKAKQYQDNEPTQAEVLLSHVDWLQYINLPNVGVEKKTGMDISTFYKKMRTVQNQFSIPNRATLALACIDAGIVFDVPTLPEGVIFTDKQLDVISLTHYSYEDISEKLNTSFQAINDMTTLLKKKMKARSRTEMAIMARLNNLVPRVDEAPDYLKVFTLFQREIIPHLLLEDTEAIMNVTGLSKDAVGGAVSRMLERVGLDKRRQLALYLYEHGYEFNIPEPIKPMADAFNTDRLYIYQNLDLTDDELVERTGVDVSRLHYDIAEGFRKTGARNRTELLLMARKYGHGEFATPPEKQTKEERLASKLGLVTLDHDHLNALLETIGVRERKLIKAYYFTDEHVTWRTVAVQYELGRTLSMVTARNGVMRLKRMLDAEKLIAKTTE
ncbi:MAG: hypothetical protein ABIP50_03380 [Candidatus Saccharimonadales bacterium]